MRVDLDEMHASGFKAIARGYSFTVTPVSWTGRSSGSSKFSIAAAGSYARILASVARERRRLAAGATRE